MILFLSTNWQLMSDELIISNNLLEKKTLKLKIKKGK